MHLRSLLSLGLLTTAVLWVATAGAQPGTGSGTDTRRLQTEIEKLKAALADAEARLEKAPTESDKLAEAIKKLLDAEKKGSDKKGPEAGKGGRGFDKGDWGGWGKGYEKGGWGGWGKEGFEKGGKGAATESDKLIQALKELLEKKGPPAKVEATKGSSIEQRLDALQKSLDEIRREIRKR
jgi:hypothetical protein